MKLFKTLAAIILILGLAATTWAGAKFETLSVNTAIGISSTLLAPATSDAEAGRLPIAALIGPVETDAIRFTTDGTTPSSTVGHLLQVGQTLNIDNYSQIIKFKAIKVTTTASVPVTVYYGPKIQ